MTTDIKPYFYTISWEVSIMKRIKLYLIPLLLCLLVTLTACGMTKVDENADVTLTFISYDKNISVILSPEESAKVAEILSGNRYRPLLEGAVSCGFDRNISLKVGNRTYAIACDTCNYVQDLGNLRFFSIPEQDMEYIHELFESKGGYFPCI